MAKQVPDGRRDSILSHISTGGSHGCPSPALLNQPQHYRPIMAGPPEQAPVTGGGDIYAAQQQLLTHLKAQMTPPQFQYLTAMYRHVSDTVQSGQIKSDEPLDLVGMAHYVLSNIDSQNGARIEVPDKNLYSPRVLPSNAPSFPSRVPHPSGGKLGSMAFSPLMSAPGRYNGPVKHPGEGMFQVNVHAGTAGPQLQMGSGSSSVVHPQSQWPANLDPRLAAAQETSSALAQPNSQLDGVYTAQAVSMPNSGSPAVLNPAQLVGVKRPLPTQYTPYTEGPAPKVALFSTAAPSRPNSASGMRKANPGPRIAKGCRLNEEAMGHGVHSLDMSKQKFDVNAKSHDVQWPGKAMPGSLDFTQDMVHMRMMTMAQDKAKQIPKTGKQTLQFSMATGLPVLLPAASNQPKAPAIIDLTGPDASTHEPPPSPSPSPPPTPQPATKAVVKAVTPVPPAPDAPTAQDLHQLALAHGVCMIDIELSFNIQASTTAWLTHHYDLAIAQSLLDPSPATLKRKRTSPTAQPAHANVMDNSHAEALGLPQDFDFGEIVRKVRRVDYASDVDHYDMVLTEVDGNAMQGCEKDADGLWRAPEPKGPTEENASLLWELQTLGVEGLGVEDLA